MRNGDRNSLQQGYAFGNSAFIAESKRRVAGQSDVPMREQIVNMPVKVSGFVLRQAAVTRESRFNASPRTSDVHVIAGWEMYELERSHTYARRSLYR